MLKEVGYEAKGPPLSSLIAHVLREDTDSVTINVYYA